MTEERGTKGGESSFSFVGPGSNSRGEKGGGGKQNTARFFEECPKCFFLVYGYGPSFPAFVEVLQVSHNWFRFRLPGMVYFTRIRLPGFICCLLPVHVNNF